MIDPRDVSDTRARQRIALGSVIAAGVLLAVKLAAGLASGSLGLVAEAAHSGTDLVAAVLTLFAIRVAGRPADATHTYGHGKAEHLAALAESTFLIGVSLVIGYEALVRLLVAHPRSVHAAWWTFVLVAFVIALDLSRLVTARSGARRFASPALASNALHFATDLGGTVAVLVGLLAVRAGQPRADAGAGLLVAVVVVVAAARLARESIDVLMDRASEQVVASVTNAVWGLPGVSLRRLRIRQAAGRQFIDLVVSVGADAALAQAHGAADAVESAIEAVVTDADVMVHVEPQTATGDLRERATAAALSVPGVREVHNVRLVQVAEGYELSLHAKLPGDLPLGDAHRVAEALEAAIRRDAPGVRAIHTHIEPLAATGTALLPASGTVAPARRVIEEQVRTATGHRPNSIRFHDTAAGRVALVEVNLPAGQSLATAHERAGEIERAVRARCPELADVVVHTEPAGG